MNGRAPSSSRGDGSALVERVLELDDAAPLFGRDELVALVREAVDDAGDRFITFKIAADHLDSSVAGRRPCPFWLLGKYRMRGWGVGERGHKLTRPR